MLATQGSRVSVRRASWVGVMLACSAGPSLAAQSVTSGSLSGVVRASDAATVRGALVTLTAVRGSVQRSMTTRSNGEFAFPLLAPGTYEILVEHLGYRPKRVGEIPVPPGVAVRTSVTLERGAIDTVDVQSFPAVLAGRAPALVDRLSMAALGPDLRRDAVDLTRRSSALSVAPWSDGLPSSLNGVYWDGVAMWGSHHPSYAAVEQPLTPPLGSVGAAEVVLNGADVEWHGAAGPILSAHSRRGTGALRLDVTADATASALTSSQYFDPAEVSGTSFRTHATLSGPLIRDSAEFVLGVDVQRLEQPRAAMWPTNALSSALIGVAQDSFGINLAPYTQAGISQTDATSMFGRFDWRAVQNHTVSVRGLVADLKADLDALGARSTGLGAQLGGRDYSALVTLNSILGRAVTQEFRVSFTGSRRDYQSADVTPTRIVDAGLSFGGDPSLVADMHRSTFQVGEVLHVALPNHRLKVGGTFSLGTFDNTFADEYEGAFAFAGTGEFTASRGVFSQTVGPPPIAKFRTLDFGGFLQDRWSAAPGLDLLFGFRFDDDLPNDEIQPNDSLRQITGLENAEVPGVVIKWSPRFGMRWDIGERGAWVVSAAAGLYHSAVEPGLLTELITGDGPVRGRRGLGNLGDWPGVPDSTIAPVTGSRMTLLGPDFVSPRSSRVGFSLSHAVGLTALHFSAAYRHTDFLPRRTDLNRLPAPAGADQYGRPLYGTLVQQGSLLAAQANRRFTTFDRIWAVNADGFSDYLGLTVTLTREARTGARFLASYTYSQTKDNWLGGSGGAFASQLNPFPDSLNSVDWTDDRSDYDVPHRVVFGLELPLPGPFVLGGMYRYESGAPFTPGFRPGVDANGDGADDNDPAYIDDAISGVPDLLGSWDCLATQVGAFAARNSCREPGAHRLDLRLTVTPFRLGATPVHIVLDGLNLVESDVGLRDHALYLVDRTGTVTTNPGTGVTTVPLIANPAFGNVLARRTTGLVLRLGVRVGGGE